MKMTAAGHEQFSRLITNGISRCEKTGRPFMTGFLTPARQEAALRLCSGSAFAFAGGRKNAISRRLIVFADQASLAEAFDYATLLHPRSQSAYENLDFEDGHKAKQEPAMNEEVQETDRGTDTNRILTADDLNLPEYVSVLRSAYDGSQKKLRHSDILGALMHAGLERDAIGDIAADGNHIFIVCLPSIAEFICQNIRQIGRIPVEFDFSDTDEMPPAVFTSLKINTASMRADCIVSALAHCSRSGAKDMICQGFVKVNDEVLESVKTLCNNDTISVRRVGKFRIGKLDGVSRKNRLIVHIDKYE